MGIHVLNSTLTFCWAVPVNAIAPAKADFDILLTKPDGSATYTDDGVTTYTPPTATAQGQVTYDLLVDQLGRYQAILSIGGSTDFVVQAEREVYVVELPPNPAPKTTSGPEIIPPIPPTPPGPGGTYDLENIAYLDIQSQTSAELSGSTTNGILDGWYQTWYYFDTGTLASAVPASWVDFAAFSSIGEALEHAAPEHLRWGYLDAPAVAGQDDPYSLFANDITSGVDGYMQPGIRHIFPTETNFSVYFTATFASAINDESTRFMYSAEGGPGACPFTEWDVTANDNDRFGIGLVGTPLPDVSINFTDELSNFSTVGSNTALYDMASDGTNIYITGNQSEILRSTDGGTTFADCFTLGGTLFFTKIAASATYVIAFASTGGIYRSADNGDTWSSLGTKFTGALQTLQFFDGTTDYFIAAGAFSGNYRMYRSTDGNTWTEFGTGISTSALRKGQPRIFDVGSGNELFLGYQHTEITKLSPTDTNETTYQAPPSASLLIDFYCESGLTVFWDFNNSGMFAYNGTTEYSHDLYWDLRPELGSFHKQGTNIFCASNNLIPYGTSAEWLTADGANLGKIPTAFDDNLLHTSAVYDGTNWIYACSGKGKLYSNPTGI